MSTGEPPEAPGRLRFGVTFGAAFATVFGRFGMFVKAAALPLLLSVIIEVGNLALRALAAVGNLAIDPEGWAAVLLEFASGILALLPFAILGIAVIRLRLIGVRSSAPPSPLLSRRTFVYAGYLLLLTLLFVLLTMTGLFAGIAVLQSSGMTNIVSVSIFFIGAIVGLCVLLYPFLRISLVLPAVALDEKLGLIGSWRLTRGGGVKLVGVSFLLFLVLIVAILVGSLATGGGGVIRLGTPRLVIPEGIGPGGDWIAIVLANLPRNLWNLVAKLVVFAMGSSSLASAYAQLKDWGTPRADILERFE